MRALLKSPKFTLALILVGLAVPTIAALTERDLTLTVGVLVVVGALISTFGAVRQYSESKPFVFSFDENTRWDVEEETRSITVPVALHNKGINTTVTVYECHDGTLEEIIPHVKKSKAGDVTVIYGIPNRQSIKDLEYPGGQIVIR